MSDTETKTDKPSLLQRGVLTKRPWRLAAFALGTLVATSLVMGVFKKDKEPEYRVEAVRRTDVTRGVSASGTIQAVDSVTIGSEVSGQITEVLADFNQEVKKDQLLAIIDTETFEARVRQAQAQLDSAQADARVSDSNFERQKRLFEANLVAEKTMEDADAARERARANLRQAQASLSTSRADLAKANIRSPIDGIVVNRTVDRGQTVAASLNAPELFVIAKDLSRLQINISVDEADIGQVKEGQLVRFTVDAFPDDNFEGRVTQVRKQPAKSANVVTYVVIAEAANPQRKLLPGMTANADIVIEEHKDVLAAPASGLRWRPEGAASGAANGQRAGQAGGGLAAAAGGGGLGAGAGGGARAIGGDLTKSPLLEGITLDAAQKAGLKTIQDGQRAKMMAIFAQAQGDRTKMRDLFMKQNQELNAQIGALLKPDQKAKFEANLAKVQAQMAQMGAGRAPGGPAGQAPMQRRAIYVLADGAPKEVAVLIGANDGTLVEIRPVKDGDIKEGDMVITGSLDEKPRAQQAGAAGGRPPAMMPFGGP